MTKFTIKQIVVELDGGQLAAVALNEEQRALLEYMLPAVFEEKPISVVALNGVKMVPAKELEASR